MAARMRDSQEKVYLAMLIFEAFFTVNLFKAFFLILTFLNRIYSSKCCFLLLIKQYEQFPVHILSNKERRKYALSECKY